MFRKKISVLIFFMAFSMTIANDNFKWIDVRKDKTIAIDGLPWFAENRESFHRLPNRVNNKINEYASSMGKCPSGARIRFKTDSTVLKLKITHGMKDQSRHSSAKLSYWNLSSISASGIDLYIGAPSDMNFWMTTEPKDAQNEYEHLYFQNKSQVIRELTLYLPTYAELAELKIGIDPNAVILPPTPYRIKKPIVFYGTSITQGACASRGSNGYVPIVGRRLNADIVNLGFSSGGCGEEIMAQLIAEIDASIYVVDSVGNMDAELMEQRYEKFVKILREKKPDIPVVLMTKIHFAKEIEPEIAGEYDRLHIPLFATYKTLKGQGDDKVYLFDCGAIILSGHDHPTADGVHLNDLGFKMVADELAPFLGKIIDNSR
jgi:lysophospholipase L1-like esterase